MAAAPHKKPQELTPSPKAEAVEFAHGCRFRITRVLTFYSHTRRSAAETAEDHELCIDRRVFSNLYPQPVDIGAAAAAHFGLVQSAWPSSEHVFQAAKCALQADQHFIATLSPGDAARYGQGRMQLTAAQKAELVSLGVQESDFAMMSGGLWKRTKSGYVPLVNGWEDTKKLVMLAALRAKCAQGEMAETMTALTNNREHQFFMVEHTTNDRQWADAGDGSGFNMLGKLLTLLLLERRDGLAVVEPLDTDFLSRPNNAFVSYH